MLMRKLEGAITLSDINSLTIPDLLEYGEKLEIILEREDAAMKRSS